MNPSGKTLKNFILLAVATMLAFPVRSAAATVKTIRHHSQAAKRRKHTLVAHPPYLTTAGPHATRTVSHPAHSGKLHHTYARSRKGRTHRKTASRNKVRFASIHMQPERAHQIQQALINAGSLHEAPTGQWDSETREAMRQYQQRNGFPATGLPDAKSLMKLGLGPHPLPLDADPIAQAKAFPPTTPGVKPAGDSTQQDQPEN